MNDDLELNNKTYSFPSQNVKYPKILGMTVKGIGPEYIQDINGNDTSYYIRNYQTREYNPIVGTEPGGMRREKFRKAFLK